MLRYILLLVFFTTLVINSLHSQSGRIEATVKNLPPGKVFLSEIKGEEQKFIDSLFVSGTIIRFNLEDPIPGVYRVTMGKSLRASFYNEDPQFFDIVINNENEIVLETDFNIPVHGMKVISSEENRMYYDFLVKEMEYRNRASYLMPLFSVYSAADDFYADVKKEFARLQRSFTDSVLNLANRNSGSLASAIMRFSLVPSADPSVGYTQMTNFLKAHFFDLVSFTDERLIRSQVYTKKIIEYLSLYGNSNVTQGEQEDEYIKAVDIIMERASYNEKVFEFVLSYLVDGFDRLKMEKVLVHLAEHYVETGCETDSKKIMEQRLDAYKKMAQGNTVKDIVLLDMNGKSRKLSELKNKYVLIIFWSTSCPHCTRLLPELKSWYESNSRIDLGVFSVSIDTSRFDWEEHLLMNDYPWINVCNFQGWEGKVAADYNIYATPTMFIVDKNRKILAKPLTFREFRREVEKIAGDGELGYHGITISRDHGNTGTWGH